MQIADEGMPSSLAFGQKTRQWQAVGCTRGCIKGGGGSAEKGMIQLQHVQYKGIIIPSWGGLWQWQNRDWAGSTCSHINSSEQKLVELVADMDWLDLGFNAGLMIMSCISIFALCSTSLFFVTA